MANAPHEAPPPLKGNKTGLARVVAAFGHSMAGLRETLRHEAAFRQECACALVLVPAAWWLADAPLQRAMLIGSVLLVLVVELLNSAIEAVVDRASPERHPLAKRAKDAGSAAVMLAIVNAVVVWTLVLL